MHEHNECEHELKYCKHCDVVYCCKCKKEWKVEQPTWIYPYYPYTQPYISYTVDYTMPKLDDMKITCKGEHNG